MAQQSSMFNLLKTRSILDILVGDVDFGEIEMTDTGEKAKISMPYLSGPVLCDISNRFGMSVTYGKGAQSRWAYLYDLLAYCIENHRESDLLEFLFSKEQFVVKLRGHSSEAIEFAYTKIIEAVISQINGVLYFGGNELVMVGGKFIIKEIGVPVKVDAPAIKTIDRAYIVEFSERAMLDVIDGNYDSAITKSRTLLEEVFFYVIEKKDETPSTSGDIGRLYSQVKQLYNMHQDKDIDKRINGLLSGLEKILSAVAEMRNKGSDSHGIGARRINIAEHHARLFVNSAMTMADFVLSVGDRSAE